MEPGCLLLLIAVKMQSAKNTVPKASKNTMKPIGIAFSKPCYVGSAGLSLRAFRHFLHSQHAFLPLLYRRRAIVKLQSANPYLRRDRPACKPPWPSLICMQCSRLTITQPLTPTFTLDIFMISMLLLWRRAKRTTCGDNLIYMWQHFQLATAQTMPNGYRFRLTLFCALARKFG